MIAEESSGHINWGLWSFDYAVLDSEGLCLLNGSYRGVPIIGKFSLPVIRVKYLVDGGWEDLRRITGTGAGPYADQIQWKLDDKNLVHRVAGEPHALQRISDCGDRYICIRSRIDGDVGWLELGVIARIGAYYIYQVWHLSQQGTILPQVWSRGLTINMDHTHHPYWRLDFDIDGWDANRVYVVDDGKYGYYDYEVNDVKNLATNRSWFVRNEKTGAGAWIFPPTEGSPDGFSGIDVAVRRWNKAEEDNPWPFGTNGLGFLNGEYVGSSDIVFWSIAHLYHHAHEGGEPWNGIGPTIQVDLSKRSVAVPLVQRLRPGDMERHTRIFPEADDFGITVRSQKDQYGGELTVTGIGFTARERVEIYLSGIPRRAGSIQLITTADVNGRFTHSESVRCTSEHQEDAFTDVDVAAFDLVAGRWARATVKASIWVC